MQATLETRSRAPLPPRCPICRHAAVSTRKGLAHRVNKPICTKCMPILLRKMH